MITEHNRSVLIICNSINEGKELYDILLDIYNHENVMKYFTEDDKDTIEKTLEIKKNNSCDKFGW
jgi:CRISPR/Cas system-associated endonuclease/helicase Cas3